MRQPSTYREAFAWHRACLAGERPPTHEDEVQCGYFRARMVKGGPWVPAKIWLTRVIDIETGELAEDETYHAIIDGETRDPVWVWNWVNGNPITKEQFEELCSLRERMPSMAATHAQFDLAEKAMRP